MTSQNRRSVVRNMAIKSMILGLYVGAWAGLFMAGSDWAFAPAIVSVLLSGIGGLIIWIVMKESSKAIWIGLAVAFVFLILSSCVGGPQLIDYAGSAGAGFTAIAVGFEIIGALVGAVLFLIIGVIIGLIRAFRTTNA